MSYLGYHQLKVKGIEALQSIEQLSIEIAPNRHARIKLRGLLDEQAGAAYLEEKLEHKPITLVSLSAKEQPLFAGQVVDANVINDKGVWYLELEGLSGTLKLDLKPYSRSFQNTQLTYQQVIGQVIQDIAHCMAKYQVGQNEPIKAPLIQYSEKNWDFIRRLASHFGAVVVPDVTSPYPRFYFGMPEGASFTLEPEVDYQVTRDFGRFHELGGAAAGYRPEDFLAYQVRTWREFDIGDQVKFKGKQLVVGAKKGQMEKGLWVYTYTLGFTPAFGLKRRYNTKISGMSLQGKVLETKGERLKVHLDIDQAQDPATAYAYPWVPTSGNMMYCMPQVGTKVVLYFPNEHEEQARITGCVRTNGGECEATGDPNNRYFNTEHGKQLALKPSELSLAATGNEASPLRLAMLDDTGIMFENPKKLQLFAKDKIEFTSDKWIRLESMKSFDVSKMDFTTGTPTSLLALKYECNLWPKVRIEASSREALEVSKQEKKEFVPWKFGVGLFLGALAVAAVAATIFFAPVLLPALALSGAVCTAMATAAGAAGAITLGFMAYDDISQGKNSRISDYIIKGFSSAVGGAISALPFGGGTLVSVAVLNGLGGFVGTYVESGSRYLFRGDNVNWGQTFGDANFAFNTGLIAGGGSYGVQRGFQKAIGNNLLKQTSDKGAASFIRQYANKYAANATKYAKVYNNTIGKITGGAQKVTTGQARVLWETKFVKAFTSGNSETVTNLSVQSAAKEVGNIKGAPITKGVASQVLRDRKLFEEAAFQTEGTFRRATPDLVGNPLGEGAGRFQKYVKEKNKRNDDDFLRSKAEQSLIVKGAALKCTCGSQESRAGLTKCSGVSVTGIPILTAENKRAMENVMDFGSCSNMRNNKCVPNIVGEWNQPKQDVTVNGYFGVTTESWLTCSKGGQIKVKKSGQKIK